MTKRSRLVGDPKQRLLKRQSATRVRADATPQPSAWADPSVDGTPTPEYQGRTREAPHEPSVAGYASQVNEIRRLYAEGEVDAALDLASMVRPSTMTFSLLAVPQVIMSQEQLLVLPIDARTGFLLARIDGVSTLQTLLDVSSMPASDAMALLEELMALGAVRLLPPPVTDL
jgi:hypothetical protein